MGYGTIKAYKPAAMDKDAYGRLLRALGEISPVPIASGDAGVAHGCYDCFRNKIIISRGLDEERTIKATIHQIARAIVHGEPDGKPLRHGLDRNGREMAADAAAYIACQRLGLDAPERMIDYAARNGGLEDAMDLEDLLPLIRRIADGMSSGIERRMAGTARPSGTRHRPYSRQARAASATA